MKTRLERVCNTYSCPVLLKPQLSLSDPRNPEHSSEAEASMKPRMSCGVEAEEYVNVRVTVAGFCGSVRTAVAHMGSAPTNVSV